MTTFETIFAPISACRILDVATGRGGFIQTLLKTLQDYDEIIAIDSNADYASAFGETFADKPVSYQQMDASALEFSDELFDTVCISNSLHHMTDPSRVLTEMQRVLKPDGIFIISEMMRDNLSEPQMTHLLIHHWWGAVDSAMGIVHHETYTRQQLIDFAKTITVKNWEFHEVAYLDDDPKDAETIAQLDGILDRYIKKTENLQDREMLQKRGQALRERVHEVGFHGATALVAIGVK